MSSNRRALPWLTIALLAIGVAAPVWSREPAPAKRKPLLKVEDVVADPAVEAVLESGSTTPGEWVREANILAGLGRPDLAKGLLQRVLKAKLKQAELATLVDRFGSAMFTELARRDNLTPEAKQLSDAVLAAANLELQDRKRLVGLIAKLQDPSIDVRSQALAGLKDARGPAVGALVEVLADPKRTAEHPNVRAALVRFGADARRPLVGILESPDARLVVQAIEVLAAANARKATVYLLAPFASAQSKPEVRVAAEAALRKLMGHVPSQHQAAELLAEETRSYFDRHRALRSDAADRVEVWFWDFAANRLMMKRYPSADAALLIAARLARQAHAVAPDDHEITLLKLATQLELAAYQNGLSKPLPSGEGTVAAEVGKSGARAVEDTLELAIATNHIPAATAAARILGSVGTADALLFQGPKKAPLVRAAEHADRRLRFAAIESIMRLKPAGAFAGSSQVLESIGFFAASGGTRRALIGGPGTAASQQIAGALVELGYQVDRASTGKGLTRLATGSPDYELAFIDVTIAGPTIDSLLQQLRRDYRTASLPVGLLAPAGRFEEAKRLARLDPFSESFARPHSAESIQWQLTQLADLLGRRMVSPAEREQQASQSLRWLAELSSAGQKVFNAGRVEQAVLAALDAPRLSPEAVAVLRNLGTTRSQKALVELASRLAQPLALRKLAAEALHHSFAEHGILLTSDEIRRQYDRYNQSATLDRGTQQVLAMILDAIEGGRAANQTGATAPRQEPAPVGR